ncbi:MAG: DMT family transporter [Chloroflexi bacterium]|nr:DMT family transporter [Chloroflexota bacterium]
MNSHVVASIFLVLLSALCVGIGSALMKLLLGRMSVFRLGLYRAFFGFLINVPVLVVARDWEQWEPSWAAAGAGLLNASVTLSATLTYMKTVQIGSLSTVQPITRSYPLFALLLGSVILGERVTLPLLMGTLAITTGLCGLILGSSEGIHRGSFFGKAWLWALVCSFVLGLLAVTTKIALWWIPAVSLNFLDNAAVLLAYYSILLVQNVKPWRGIGWRDITLAALAGVLTLGLSGIFFNLAVRHIPVMVASPLFSTSLLFSVIFGILFFGERISGIQVLGSLLALAGVAAIAIAQG